MCFGLRPEEEIYDVKADPRASGRGGVFARYPVWAGGSPGKMGGYNRAGQLGLFDKTQYVRWMNENGQMTQSGHETDEE